MQPCNKVNVLLIFLFQKIPSQNKQNFENMNLQNTTVNGFVLGEKTEMQFRLVF